MEVERLLIRVARASARYQGQVVLRGEDLVLAHASGALALLWAVEDGARLSRDAERMRLAVLELV